MRRSIFHAGILLATIPLLAVATGCGVRYRAPLYVSPTIEPASIQTITVLPVLNASMQSEIKFDLNKTVHWVVINTLKKLKYKMVPIRGDAAAQGIEPEALESLDAAWIKGLGPQDSRWLLVVSLEDVASKLTFGSTGQAEVKGWLFDREEGLAVWRDKGTAAVGQGGLLGMTLKGLMARDAVAAATGNLLQSFPRKAKK